MTKAQIKEKLSPIYVELLATQAGYKTIQPLDDHGVDIMIRQMAMLSWNNKTRHIDTGRTIGVQLKCTTESSITEKDEKIFFDLKVKNFNDLIWRKRDKDEEKGVHNPLLLILLILPNDEEKRVYMNPSEDRITFSGKAFWFYPDNSAAFSTNLSSIRITIPKKHQLNLDSFQKIFNLFFNKNH